MDEVLSGVQSTAVTSFAFQTYRYNLNHHHVAVVLSLKSGKVLASGVNHATMMGSVHAEVDAMNQMHRRRNLIERRELRKGLCLLSLRITRAGKLRLAKPCAACESAIRRCTLMRRIVWSENDGTLVHMHC